MVLEQTRGPIIVLQDGVSYHTAAKTKAFIAAHADRLTVHQLSSYSPDYNPIEPRPNQCMGSARPMHADREYYSGAPRPPAGRPDIAGDAIVQAAG
jgi:hypothetical protein